MVTLSAFADEISADLNEQLDVLESEGIRHIELRGVWQKNVLDLTNEDLGVIKNTLDQRGFRLSAIGSPIGKISITDDFEKHLTAFERAIYCATYFGIKFIRIFSFFIPDNSDHLKFRGEVIRRMKMLTREAERKNVILLHENEKGTYGDTPERCLEILSACDSPNLMCAYDPANFVQCGVKPYTDAFPLLKPYIKYIHVKDASMDEGKEVPAGQGDGELYTFLKRMTSEGYDGFMSLEPHLSFSGPFQGYTGPGLFRVATRALKDLLSDLGQDWN